MGAGIEDPKRTIHVAIARRATRGLRSILDGVGVRWGATAAHRVRIRYLDARVVVRAVERHVGGVARKLFGACQHVALPTETNR